ncbi:MAG: hypothetical protein QXW32_01765 [Nitrososphaerales archaeon]
MSYIDFGLALAGAWFATLTGAVALIIVVIEFFKKFGVRSEESTQSAETKIQASEEKIEQLSEEEATTVVALAAIQAYLSEEQKEATES